MNRFKGLDLVNRAPEELRTEVHNIVQETKTKTIQRKRNARRQRGYLKSLKTTEEREAKSKGAREGPTQLNAELQRIAKREKKSFNEQCKEIEENNRRGKTRDLFKKIGDIKGTCHAKMGTIKDRNGKDLIEGEGIKKRWQEYT